VQCAVTLFGKQYDVTNLRNTHSGGNIFNCGTDMTAVYQSRHGTNMSRMQQYLIPSGGTTSSTANTAGSTNTTNAGGTTSTVEIHRGEDKQTEQHKDEDERRDEDHEEEEKEHLESFLRDLLQLAVS
jgi:uncharacterized caspase-like protein